MTETDLKALAASAAKAAAAKQTADFAERETSIATREAALIAKEALVARAATVDFVEALVTKGQVLPIQKAAFVEALMACDGKAAVDFAEGDKTVNKTPRAALEAALTAMPKLVDYSERAKPTGSSRQPAAVGVPSNYTTEADRAELHVQALQYAEQNKCDYVTAVKAVEAQT